MKIRYALLLAIVTAPFLVSCTTSSGGSVQRTADSKPVSTPRPVDENPGNWALSGNTDDQMNFDPSPVFGTLYLDDGFRNTDVTLETGQKLHAGNNGVSAGSHRISARRFGFEDIDSTVEITEDSVSRMDAFWIPAQLRPLSLQLSPVWLDDKTVSFSFSVSAEGTGVLEIVDDKGQQLASIPVGPFLRRDQKAQWAPDKNTVATLQPGRYRAILRVSDAEPLSLDFTLDYRKASPGTSGFWSSASGSLFAPVATTLQPGQYALSASLLGTSGNGYTHILENTAFLLGVDKNWESDFSIANRIWNDSFLNSWYVTAGVKNTFAELPLVQAGWYSSLSLSGFWDSPEMDPPTTDPFTNPAGVKAGGVLTFGGGTIKASIAPELLFAFKGVSYTADDPAVPGFAGYLRGSIDIRAQFAQYFFSFAVRGKNPAGGFGIQLPLQAGAEVRLIPSPGTGINLMSALEWWKTNDWTLYLGVGVSLQGKAQNADQRRYILEKP
jgi:hypothetical protein